MRLALFSQALASRRQTGERVVCANRLLPPALCDQTSGQPLLQYANNEVLTAKYSLISFIPKNLFEQFRRLANMFFLMLVILQTFPEFKTLDPSVVALPVIIIVLVTAMKDGFEDYKRHVTDRQVNNRIVTVLGGNAWHNVNHPTSDLASLHAHQKPAEATVTGAGNALSGLQWIPVCWSSLRVGDFVMLKNNEFIPADIVVLSTSESDCLCYLETKNLDGETNLKIRRGLTETSSLQSPEDCVNVKFTISSEAPNNNMFAYNGAILFNDSDDDNNNTVEKFEKIPINMNGLLLRGCILRNTEWVIGCVIYTGCDTKLRLNAGETPSKRSIIEKKMNVQIVIQLIVLVIMAVICTIASDVWSKSYSNFPVPFMPSDAASATGKEAVIAFWSSLLTFQNIVPISLYLTVEIVKTLQAYFIYSDIEMYYKPLDTPCVPKSWNLADDLGQIEYVFSDKTGTLTRNVMEFRRCSIGGVIYGPPLMTSPLTSVPKTPVPRDYTPPSLYGSENPSFYDPALVVDMAAPDSHAQTIDMFWQLLAVCHTVLVSKADSDQVHNVKYKAQSPDEAALVDTAKDMGYAFIGRQLTVINVDIRGQEMRYTLLAVLEFNSTRKRMSIITRHPNGDIVLYCKGADTVIYERLKPGHNQLVSDVTLKHLEIFADEGLRTLCLSYRVVSPEEFGEWIQQYNVACTALQDRDTKIDEAAELIEKELLLLGATAIEDKLQDGVPECIQTLREAGIKVWVLTGDKMETAISIGFSCNLLAKNMNLIVIKGGEDGQVSAEEQLQEALDTFFTASAKRRSRLLKGSGDVEPLHLLYTKNHALVIDGLALKSALEGKGKELLLQLGSHCKVVICCRVSPLQKAKVVLLVREGRGAITCAIGDGANDVSMIQAAHVGIGIAGEEGLQAVMASDYAVAQFRYLQRLLLVHGRWSYYRVGELIYNYFYKDIIFVLTNFWIQFFNGFSTEPAFDYSYLLLYNLFFTNWPVIVLGVFDKDIDATTAARIPMLYQSGIRQTIYTTSRFMWYTSEGVWQALVCYFIPYGIYAAGTTDREGYMADRVEMGTAMAAAAITNANLFTALSVHSYTWINHVAIWPASIGVFYAWVAIYSCFEDSPLWGFNKYLWRSWAFWSSIVICTISCHLPRIIYRYAQRNYRPKDVDIAQEYSKYKLDITPALPHRIVYEEPPPPPSAHPNGPSGLMPLIIPSFQSNANSASSEEQQYDFVRTPAILGLDMGDSPLKSLSVTPPTPKVIPATPSVHDSNSPTSNTYPSSAPSTPFSLVSGQGSVQIASPRVQRVHSTSSHITTIRTLTVQRNRGFSFSQDELGGMRSILMCETSVPSSSAVVQIKKTTHQSTSSDWELYRHKTVPARRDVKKRDQKNGSGLSDIPSSQNSDTSTLDRDDDRENNGSSGESIKHVTKDRPLRSAPPDVQAPSIGQAGRRSRLSSQMGQKNQSVDNLPSTSPEEHLKQYGLSKDTVTGRVIDIEQRIKGSGLPAGIVSIANTTSSDQHAPSALPPRPPVPGAITPHNKQKLSRHVRTPSKLQHELPATKGSFNEGSKSPPNLNSPENIIAKQSTSGV